MFTLARTSPEKLLSISYLLGEKHVVYRVEAVKLGLFIGSFSGSFTALSELFFQLLGDRPKSIRKIHSPDGKKLSPEEKQDLEIQVSDKLKDLKVLERVVPESDIVKETEIETQRDIPSKRPSESTMVSTRISTYFSR